MRPRVLAINPGSTSTKVSLFSGTTEVKSQSLHHDVSEFGPSLLGQLPMRLSRVKQFIDGQQHLDMVVGRGGLLHPLKSGAYLVNDDMLSDLKESRYGEHASNLGAFLAREVCSSYSPSCRAIVVDPVVVDEFHDLARFTGHPDICRRSLFHALNQKAVARRVSADLGKQYDKARLVIAHMGGGVTVGAHLFGQVVDVSNGLDGEGPMSPERSGALPVSALIDLCFSDSLTKGEIMKKLAGKGGLVAHLGTNDFRQALQSNTRETLLLVRAFAYQVAKEIGRCIAVMDGQVDAIVLTGGLANSAEFCGQIQKYVCKFAQVIRVPGEGEMLALAEGAVAVLIGSQVPHTYERWT